MYFPSSLDLKAQVITGLVLVLLVWVAWLLVRFGAAAAGAPRWATWSGALLVVAGVLWLFARSPRGVELQGDRLRLVQRIGGPVVELPEGARLRPVESLGPTIRTFGVGGLFGWFGSFRSADLGPFRLHATRLDRLVLVPQEGRQLVVSVDRPEELIAAAEGGTVPDPEGFP